LGDYFQASTSFLALYQAWVTWRPSLCLKGHRYYSASAPLDLAATCPIVSSCRGSRETIGIRGTVQAFLPSCTALHALRHVGALPRRELQGFPVYPGSPSEQGGCRVHPYSPIPYGTPLLHCRSALTRDESQKLPWRGVLGYRDFSPGSRGATAFTLCSCPLAMPFGMTLNATLGAILTGGRKYGTRGAGQPPGRWWWDLHPLTPEAFWRPAFFRLVAIDH